MINVLPMLRVLLAAAALVALASSCTPPAKCGDLCSANMPCGDVRFTCVQSRCLVDNGDAGPTTCPTM